MARFVLAPGEAIRASAEAYVDLRGASKVHRMIYLTDRRLVLCRMRAWPFSLAELAFLAAALWFLQSDPWIGRACIGALLLVSVLRGRLPQRDQLDALPVEAVAAVEDKGVSVVLALRDGGTWWLSPPRILFVLWSPFGRRALAGVRRELRRALGLFADLAPRNAP